MKYRGRIVTPLIAILIIVAWHISYFLIDRNASYLFLIKDGFLKYDYIYTPLVLPFFWWVGKQYDVARFYAERDFLTSLYNRRFVWTIFDRILEKAEKNHENLCIFVVDVNNFKRVNDTYGHEFGDSVLRHVSKVLVANTRQSDLVARWGGDEFLVIASYAENETPPELSLRINQTMAKLKLGIDVTVTLSVGYSTFPADASRPNDLIRVADERMYELKLRKPDSITESNSRVPFRSP